MSNNSLPKRIEERRLRSYKHIHTLNGYSLPKDKGTFFKYMSLDRFVSNIHNKEFVFVSPELWKDPFEKIYYGINCSSRGYTTQDIACLCITEKSSSNEDASWKAYTDSGEKAVRISINQQLFLELLDDYAENNDYEVYIGRALYGLDKKEIQNLYLLNSPYHSLFFPNQMKLMHYLSVMTLKRHAFEYENEVRVFLVKKEGKIIFDDYLVKIYCDYDLYGIVTDVMLSPYPVISAPNDLVHSVRARINKLESDELKRILKELVGCRIRQSRLYNSYTRVEKVEPICEMNSLNS